MTPDKAKIKMWKVFVKDHKIAGKIFRHDQTQPMIFSALIDEPVIYDLIIENLSKARTLNEAAKKEGKFVLAIQSADIAIRTLIEIKKILSTRNLEKEETIMMDDDEQQTRVKALRVATDLLKEGKITDDEAMKEVHVMLNWLEKLQGEPLTQ